MAIRIMPDIDVFTSRPTTEFTVFNQVKHFVVLCTVSDFDTLRASRQLNTISRSFKVIINIGFTMNIKLLARCFC